MIRKLLVLKDFLKASPDSFAVTFKSFVLYSLCKIKYIKKKIKKNNKPHTNKLLIKEIILYKLFSKCPPGGALQQ